MCEELSLEAERAVHLQKVLQETLYDKQVMWAGWGRDRGSHSLLPFLTPGQRCQESHSLTHPQRLGIYVRGRILLLPFLTPCMALLLFVKL